MMSLNDAMLKKQQKPAFAAEWDTLEPEEQVVRAIIEGREENHLTQNQLAHATGIHQTNISKLESGTANPSLRTLKRLAAGMGRKLKLEFVPAQPDSNVRYTVNRFSESEVSICAQKTKRLKFLHPYMLPAIGSQTVKSTTRSSMVPTPAANRTPSPILTFS